MMTDLIEERVMIDGQGVMMTSLVVRVEVRPDRMMVVLTLVRQFVHHHHHHRPIVSIVILEGLRLLGMKVLTIEARGSIDDGG